MGDVTHVVEEDGQETVLHDEGDEGDELERYTSEAHRKEGSRGALG